MNTKPKSYGNLSNRDLGISEFEGMIFDLEDLFPPVIDLSDLETNFTIEEVDRIISELPNDKSPGSLLLMIFMRCVNLFNKRIYV